MSHTYIPPYIYFVQDLRIFYRGRRHTYQISSQYTLRRAHVQQEHCGTQQNIQRAKAMGAGIDPGATSGNVRVEDNTSIQNRGGRAGGMVAAVTHAQQGHNCSGDHDTAAAARRDIKRTYRTIRGGKTSEVYC